MAVPNIITLGSTSILLPFLYALIIGKQASTNAHKKIKRNKKLTLFWYMLHHNDGVVDIQNNERCVSFTLFSVFLKLAISYSGVKQKRFIL